MSTIGFFPADLAICDPMMNYIETNLPQKDEGRVWQISKDLALRVAYVAVQILIFTTIAYHLIGATLKLPMCVITVPMQLFGAEVAESLKGEQVIKHLATIYSIALLTLACPFAILQSSKTCVDTYKAFLNPEETQSSLTLKLTETTEKLLESENLKTTTPKAKTPKNDSPKKVGFNLSETEVIIDLASPNNSEENNSRPPPPPMAPNLGGFVSPIKTSIINASKLSGELISANPLQHLRKSSTGSDGKSPSPVRSGTPPKEGGTTQDILNKAIKANRYAVEGTVIRGDSGGESDYSDDENWKT